MSGLKKKLYSLLSRLGTSTPAAVNRWLDATSELLRATSRANLVSIAPTRPITSAWAPMKVGSEHPGSG